MEAYQAHTMLNSALAAASSGELAAARQAAEDLESQKQRQQQQRQLLEPFHAEMDALKRALERIEQNVRDVDEKYSASLGRNVSQAQRAEASAQISTLVAQTGKTAQAVRKRLHRIAGENEQFARDHAEHTAALRIRVAAHQALTHAFMAAMQRLEGAQERHRGAVRAAVERQLRAMNPHAPEEDIRRALDHLNSSSSSSSSPAAVVDDSPLLCELPPDERARLQAQLDTLAARNHDVRLLERSIVELHQMFTDMQLLVDQQGDLLNTIEFNVQETKGKAHAAMNELVQAHDFQRKATRKKCCIALLVLALMLVISVPVVIKFAPVWFPALDDTDGTTVGTGADDSDALPTTVPSGAAATLSAARSILSTDSQLLPASPASASASARFILSQLRPMTKPVSACEVTHACTGTNS